MTVPNILQYAREVTNTSSAMTNLSDASLLPYLNMVYHEIENDIVYKVDEDYFVAEFYTNLVADQERYERQQGDSNNVGFKNIKDVMIKRDDSDTYYSIVKNEETNYDRIANDRTASTTSQ